MKEENDECSVRYSELADTSHIQNIDDSRTSDNESETIQNGTSLQPEESNISENQNDCNPSVTQDLCCESQTEGGTKKSIVDTSITAITENTRKHLEDASSEKSPPGSDESTKIDNTMKEEESVITWSDKTQIQLPDLPQTETSISCSPPVQQEDQETVHTSLFSFRPPTIPSLGFSGGDSNIQHSQMVFGQGLSNTDQSQETKMDPIDSKQEGENSESQGENSESQGENSESQGENSESQGENSESQGQNSESQGQISDSQGQISGQNLDSQGQNSESQGQSSESQGQNLECHSHDKKESIHDEEADKTHNGDLNEESNGINDNTTDKSVQEQGSNDQSVGCHSDGDVSRPQAMDCESGSAKHDLDSSEEQQPPRKMRKRDTFVSQNEICCYIVSSNW